jgi:hypothetical protein
MRDDGIKTIRAGGEPQSSGPANLTAPSNALESFAASIRSPNLKAVAAHWVQAKGTKAMPSWEQLSPARIAPQLPQIWAYRYNWELDKFSGRLAGEKIRQIIGKNIHGLSLDEIFPANAVGWTHHLFHRVVQEPALYRSTGRIFSHLNRWGIGERIILPLSSDGIEGDGILGATCYHYSHPSTLGETGMETETEQWFCLRPERFGAD